MKQKRLEAIASFLHVKDRFIDIGTDHAYIPIYMAKKGCKEILATDIHPKALAIAQKNISEEHLESQIKTLVADGLKNITVKNYDTLVIAGMGASTIKKILSSPKELESIKKIIIQSNNDLEMIRRYMNEIQYGLKEEKIIQEKHHYYIIMMFEKMHQKLSDLEYEFGLYKKENKTYYQYLQKYYLDLYQKIPENQEDLRKNIKKKIKVLTKLIKKNRI